MVFCPTDVFTDCLTGRFEPVFKQIFTHSVTHTHTYIYSWLSRGREENPNPLPCKSSSLTSRERYRYVQACRRLRLIAWVASLDPFDLKKQECLYSQYEYFLIYYMAVAGFGVRWGPGHTADTTNHHVTQNGVSRGAFPGM